jgi:Niemann-Pick C1 protein
MLLNSLNYFYKMLEDSPQTGSRVQLSIVQGYMSKFYRSTKFAINAIRVTELFLTFLVCLYFRCYGTWVARNPILVLSLSLAVILLLCLGLIRFKVATRPEKVELNIQIASLIFSVKILEKEGVFVF